MRLYVLALTDVPLEPWQVGRRRLHPVGRNGIYAICDRRAAVPPATDEELREQHALVVAIAARVRAILPVRFGAIIDKGTLLTLLRDHDAEIRAALDDVRDRVQMTLRIVGLRRARIGPVSTSGREYLETRRRIMSPPLPKPARSLLSALQPMVARERREAGAGRLLATVYHLIDAADAPRYKRAVSRVAPHAAIVSGPWPPFAFTPQFW